jgi:hypothetical protein
VLGVDAKRAADLSEQEFVHVLAAESALAGRDQVSLK